MKLYFTADPGILQKLGTLCLIFPVDRHIVWCVFLPESILQNAKMTVPPAEFVSSNERCTQEEIMLCTRRGAAAKNGIPVFYFNCTFPKNSPLSYHFSPCLVSLWGKCLTTSHHEENVIEQEGKMLQEHAALGLVVTRVADNRTVT